MGTCRLGATFSAPKGTTSQTAYPTTASAGGSVGRGSGSQSLPGRYLPASRAPNPWISSSVGTEGRDTKGSASCSMWLLEPQPTAGETGECPAEGDTSPSDRGDSPKRFSSLTAGRETRGDVEAILATRKQESTLGGKACRAPRAEGVSARSGEGCRRGDRRGIREKRRGVCRRGDRKGIREKRREVGRRGDRKGIREKRREVCRRGDRRGVREKRRSLLPRQQERGVRRRRRRAPRRGRTPGRARPRVPKGAEPELTKG